MSPNDQQPLRDGTVLRHIVAQRGASKTADMAPANAFEAVTRQIVVDVQQEIHSLRTRIDSIFSVVVGAIILDLLLRLAGWG